MNYDNDGNVTTVDRQTGVVEIVFSHPIHNSLPSHILENLAQHIQNAGRRDDVTIVWVKSKGDRTYCAGASFNELLKLKKIEDAKRFFMGFARVISAIRNCPKLVFGTVQGKVVGGGIGLVSALDYCIATKFASIKLSELNVGIGPFVVETVIRRKMGVASVSEMALQPNKFFDSEWASMRGLYAEIVENTDELHDKADLLISEWLSYSKEAILNIKKIQWENSSNLEALLETRAEMSASLVLKPEAQVFLDKYRNQ